MYCVDTNVQYLQSRACPRCCWLTSAYGMTPLSASTVLLWTGNPGECTSFSAFRGLPSQLPSTDWTQKPLTVPAVHISHADTTANLCCRYVGCDAVSFGGRVCPSACYRDIWRSGGTAPLILNLGTRWSWVLSFISEIRFVNTCQCTTLNGVISQKTGTFISTCLRVLDLVR